MISCPHFTLRYIGNILGGYFWNSNIINLTLSKDINGSETQIEIGTETNTMY